MSTRAACTEPAGFRQLLLASYAGGVRAGVIRLLQVIAVVSLGAGSLELAIIAMGNGLGLVLSYLVGSSLKQQRLSSFLLVPAGLANLALIASALVGDLQIFTYLMCAHLLLDACALPAMGALQRRLFPASDRGRLIGRSRSAFMITGLICALLLGELLGAGLLSHRLILPIAGIMGLLACGQYWRMCQLPAISEIQAAAVSRAEAGRGGGFTVFLTLVSIAELAHLLLLPLLPAHLLSMGASPRLIAWLLVVIPGLGGVLGFRLWGAAIDRQGVRRVRAWGALCYAGEPVLLVLAPWCDASTVLLIAAALCRGLGLGAVVLTWSLAPLHFSSGGRCARAVGLNNIVTGLRCLLAPALGLLLWRLLGMPSLLLLCSLLMLLSALSLLALDELPRLRHWRRVLAEMGRPCSRYGRFAALAFLVGTLHAGECCLLRQTERREEEMIACACREVASSMIYAEWPPTMMKMMVVTYRSEQMPLRS